MDKDVHNFDPGIPNCQLSFSSSGNSDVSLNGQGRQPPLPLSNPLETHTYPDVSGRRNQLPNRMRMRDWRQSSLFTGTRWTDESEAEGEDADAENRKPDSSGPTVLTIPVNTSTPIMIDSAIAAESNTASIPERVVHVKKAQLDLLKAPQAPVKSVKPPSQPQHRTTPSLILPPNDDDLSSAAAAAGELPVDPYKRARKFLYRLAPLLKLSLPSRVERKRTESVMDVNAQMLRATHNTLPDPGSLRTSPWIRQWMKHGVMVQHCITFTEGEPFTPETKTATGSSDINTGTNTTQPLPSPWPSGPHVALTNADCYVQELWRELQLRLHGPLFMEELRKRRTFANTVMQRIVSFSMQPGEHLSTGPSDQKILESDCAIRAIQDAEADGCTVSPDYLTLLIAASKSVSQLLQQTDRVEQAWSSDARLVREFSDWALPEVRCRLVCLRQWSGTLTSLQRGLHQLCEFLHCSTSIQCCTHVTSVRQTTDVLVPERDSSDPVNELSSCPLLINRTKRGDHQLYREFLKTSWLMPSLPAHLFSTTRSATYGTKVNTATPNEPHDVSGNPHWGGLSMALIRLDRLVSRILVQVTDNLMPKSTPSAAAAAVGGTKAGPTTAANVTVTSTTAAATSTVPVTTPTVVLSHTATGSQIARITSSPSQANPGFSPVCNHPPTSYSAQIPRKSLAIWKASKRVGQPGQLLCPKQHRSTHSLSPLGTDRADDMPEANGTNQKLNEHLNRNWLAPRRVASYAEIVKRRSWSGHPFSHGPCGAFHRSTDMRPKGQRTPVNWEICSPAPSISPYARTPYSSSCSSRSSSCSSSSRSPRCSSESHSSSSSALSSNRSARSSSLSLAQSSKSAPISSSNSSLPSMLRPRCAMAASPTSAESCASLLSVDLCNRSSLARPPQPATDNSHPPVQPPTLSIGAEVTQPPSETVPVLTHSISSPTAAQPLDTERDKPITGPRSILASNLPNKPKDLGTELGLPTLVPLWLFLAQVPFDVTLEAVSMKLEQYDERMYGSTQPNQVSLNHLVDELRELLSTALQITTTYRKRLVTALQLDTVAQLRIPFGASSSLPSRDTRSLLSCMHSDSDSDVPGENYSGLATAATETYRIGLSGRWPDWFRRATHEVRAFLDSNPPTPNEPNQTVASRTWPVSLPALLDVYVDCFTRLIDAQTWVGEGDPCVLRSRIENEWNFLRRLYRQLCRCRGGLQYFSMRNASLAVRILPPTAEAAFIRACQRFLGLIAKQLCPAIGDWVSSSLTMRPHRNSIRSDTGPLDVTATAGAENGGKKISCASDSLSASTNGSFESASPQSSMLSVTPNQPGSGTTGTSLRTEFFQEYNETWRELRAWLNCLLDLTGVMCGDLDTSVVLNFYVPHKCSSKAGSVLSTRLMYDGLSTMSPELDWNSPPPPPPLCGLTGQLSIDSEPGDVRMRAYARLARELRRTGHVLLHSWDQPKVDELSPDVETNPSSGCIFIRSPVLQPNSLPESDGIGMNLYKFSADSTSGDRIDRFTAHEERGLVIVSPQERRAVRFHVSELVHRILRQLIFKLRRNSTSCHRGVLPSVSQTKPNLSQTHVHESHHLPSTSQPTAPVPTTRVPLSRLNGNRGPPIRISGETSVTTGYRRVTTNNLTGSNPAASAVNPESQKRPENPSGNAANPTSNETNKPTSSASKLQAEYLLICPEFPERMWDGLVYRFSRHSDGPAQSRSAYSRRLRYALSWLALMSTRGTLAPLFTASVELTNLITCHLLSERPYSAWSFLCESSSRLRRWLSLGLSHMKSTGFDRNATDPMQSLSQMDFGIESTSTSPTNACILHLAPIHPDLGAACAQLHRSLCNLSARLHSSLLIMDSHLRGLCDAYADEYDRSTRGFLSERHIDVHRRRSPSPRRSTSKELTTHAMSGDTLQRAYSIVFGFHKTLMRLMATAPLTNTLQNDESPTGTSSDHSVLTMPIQTSLVNLGVQLLASWSRFVTRRYQRGRGRIPRWANDACHFAYQLCQPRSVTFLEARKVATLETTLNDLIPHLVGEEKTVDGNSLSPVLSRLSPISVHESIDKPIFERCNSAVSSTQLLRASHSFRRKHRRVHSLHSDRQPKRTGSATNRPSTRLTGSVEQQGSSLDSELLTNLGLSRDNTTTFEILCQLDAIRDERLRQVGLIGRPRPMYSEQPHPAPPVLEDAQTPKDPSSVSSRPTTPRLQRRQFPYSWNRGRFIGRGVTGEVYQAFNLQTHEMMAVKEIRFDYDTFADADSSSAAANAPNTNSDSPRERTALLRLQREAQTRLHAFRRECDLLSSLSHPAVVRFLGADEQTPKVLRLFTELYTAGTLADVVRDRLPEALVRRYAHDLARAVAYLHHRGIVHRDIKPANIFLVGSPYAGLSSHNNSGTAASFGVNASSGVQTPVNSSIASGPTQEYSLLKLGDFSHALRLHTLSNAARDGEIREVAGTVCYMAPEVCQSQSRGLVTGYGRPCDIWSYCCVILALVTGRQPWHRYQDSLAIFYRLCQNQTPPLPQVCPVRTSGKSNESRSLVSRSASVSSDDGLPYASAEAVALLQAGIQPDPSRRPTAADLFQFDFVNCPVSYLGPIELAHSR